MSQSYPDQFNNQPRHARIRDKAEVLHPGDDDDARLATNSSSKTDPLTSYVNAAQNDHSYVHEWLQRSHSNSSPTITSASPLTVVEANERDHDAGITGNSYPSDRITPASERVERILASTQKGSPLPSRSRETSLTSLSAEYPSAVARQLPVRSVEAASLEASTGTSFVESEQYVSGQTQRPHRPRSPSPERTGTLRVDEEGYFLESESMGCSPMFDSHAKGVDVDQGYNSVSRPQSHSSVRQSANEEDLVESLLESLAVAAVRSFESKDNALDRPQDDTSIDVVSATSPLLSEVATSPPPMAPMPPPPLPPLPLPLRAPGVPPADFFPMQPTMPTAFNIARSLAGARYLRRSSEPSRYVAFESKATQSDENALPRNRPRYKDSSTQTHEVHETEKQSPHPSGQSLNSISSTASKGTQTSAPSPPVSTQSGSSLRALHLHKHLPPHSRRADWEPPARLSDMRRSILTAKSQTSAKRPPANATSTKLSRIIVNPEALTLMGIPHVVHAEYVVVHRILSRQEIIQLAELTIDIREARSKGVESGERLWSQWGTDRYNIPWHRDDR